ncbi:helix-turn-helix domain-containing protein [Devosia ginsengisoli]|uniref:winged helix-turn-helix transcriptional regulator n=1 Tax=Devosia ginsengisoli TaxID=400770 RepID=UPI0026F25A98|nr:helix-turn-helix domain-containing protein [Devosia ginsengisoli]MCR6673090.1 helix-turn-helix transcriptional regulator [Devosia ginsengisoli]
MVTKDTERRPAWDVYKVTCPTRQVLDCIADKWAVLVVGLLLSGTRRFGEMRKSIEGVSQKMLTQTLRGLERDGIVARKVYASVPPKVEYSLTPLGHSLARIVEDLRLWSESNIEIVLASQQAYDSQPKDD